MPYVMSHAITEENCARPPGTVVHICVRGVNGPEASQGTTMRKKRDV